LIASKRRAGETAYPTKADSSRWVASGREELLR